MIPRKEHSVMTLKLSKTFLIGLSVCMGLCLGANVSASGDGAELVLETSDYEVYSLWHRRGGAPRQEEALSSHYYTIEVYRKQSTGHFLIHLGPDHMRSNERLGRFHLYEDHLVARTSSKIFIIDCVTGRHVKSFLAMGSVVSRSGRLIAFQEWQRRWVIPELQGAIVSILDLRTLTRRAIFPESDLIRESRSDGPANEFEGRFVFWEEDPQRRCHTYSGLLFSEDDTRIAFLCIYLLTEQAELPEHSDERAHEIIRVKLGKDLNSHIFQRYNILSKMYLVADNDMPASKAYFSYKRIRWIDRDIIEVQLSSRPWLKQNILINTANSEVGSEP